MNKNKLLGQTFTQNHIVKNMIEMSKNKIINSKIMEPSFGDGAFLMQIVEKFILEGRKVKLTDKEISNKMQKQIFGFEIDKHFYNLAIKNISSIMKSLNFPIIKLYNLLNSNALKKMNDKFDIIIGNPPYVRIQNFNKQEIKIINSLTLIHGNTDLYLIFINHYINMLNENGELIFITPNSFGKSLSAKKIRRFMVENGKIDYIDFEEQKLFANVSTYNCIFKFIYKPKQKEKSYFISDNAKLIKNLCTKCDIFHPESDDHIKYDFQVKTGIATLADKLYIFNKGSQPAIEKNYLIKCYKGSRLSKEYIAIFPYKVNKKTYEKFKSINEIKSKAPLLYKYLLKNKSKLVSRALEKNANWWEYGRSQAINDFNKDKIIIDTLIPPYNNKLNTKFIEGKSLVYSGLYSTNMNFDTINNKKLVDSFRYIAKDMRGGYKKVSSSMFKNSYLINK